MRFQPTKSGGRLAEGKSLFGDYRFEVDAAGKLLSFECVVRHPPVTVTPKPKTNCAKCPGSESMPQNPVAAEELLMDGL